MSTNNDLDFTEVGETRIGPGGIPERLIAGPSLRRQQNAQARNDEEFHTNFAGGIDELVRRTRNALAVAVAQEAVRLVAAGRSRGFRMSAEATARWHMTRQERRTAAEILRGMPDLFTVNKEPGSKAASVVVPTDKAMRILFRGKRR